MKTLLVRLTAIGLLCALPRLMPGEPEQIAKRWYKGNLHAHTLNSDGDSTAPTVIEWYREHDYRFLVLTDHNFLTEVEELGKIYGAKERFLLIPGEEVTTTSVDRKEVHVNGYGLRRFVPPAVGNTVLELLQRNVDAIRQAGGIPSLNHPNYTWAVQSRELKQVTGLGLFEVFNGSWSVGNFGGGPYESHEEMWDAVLATGRRFYGVAVDDAHDFKPYGRALPYPPTIPGTGWVVVRAESLTPENILNAIQAGDFYASTGVVLDDIRPSAIGLDIRIHRTRDNQYTTDFIGSGGKLLATSKSLSPEYRFRGGEGYVRARVRESTGGYAWTQPVFAGN